LNKVAKVDSRFKAETMEITRKIEFSVATNRRFVIRESDVNRQTSCLACGSTMLTTGQAARLFGITQRRIFQIVEIGEAHYSGNESDSEVVCLSSLAQALILDACRGEDLAPEKEQLMPVLGLRDRQF